MKYAALLLVFALAVTTASAAAGPLTAPFGLYLGASVGEASVQSYYLNPNETPPLSFDGTHIAWKIFAGVRPLRFVGFELGYSDLGHTTAPWQSNAVSVLSDNSKQSAATAFVVGYLPLSIPSVDLYGKLGVARLRTETQATILFECTFCGPYPNTVYQNEWTTDLAYGAGVQARFDQLAVRFEYERINASGGKPDLLSVGVSWLF